MGKHYDSTGDHIVVYAEDTTKEMILESSIAETTEIVTLYFDRAKQYWAIIDDMISEGEKVFGPRPDKTEKGE